MEQIGSQPAFGTKNWEYRSRKQKNFANLSLKNIDLKLAQILVLRRAVRYYLSHQQHLKRVIFRISPNGAEKRKTNLCAPQKLFDLLFAEGVQLVTKIRKKALQS